MPGVKRGDWVLVEDVAVFQGTVVVVIGMTAVIRVPRTDAGGHTCRAAEVRCCRALSRGHAGKRPAQAGTGPDRAKQLPPLETRTRASVIGESSASTPQYRST